MFISVNGKLLDASEAAIRQDDRSYRYGDGLFETMKSVNGVLQLAEFHMERLFKGINKLSIDWPALLTKEKLISQVREVCIKNKCEDYGRVRLSVSAGHGGLFDPGRKANYCIEAWPLSLEMGHLNSNGLTIGIYPEGKKSNDSWSNLKSSSSLLYSMAAVYAKAQHWNDALIVNTEGNLADSCIANVFIVKEGKVYTPPLKDGGVEGIMRRLLLKQLPDWGFEFEEKTLAPTDLKNADEVFLTNAIRGIRWVKQLDNCHYNQEITQAIYKQLQTIWK